MTLSVYIDCENICPDYADQIFEKLSSLGAVVAATGYADFSIPLHAAWREALFRHKIRAIQTFHNTKDNADAEILIDVVSDIEKPVDAICIVSRDGIYSSLARVARNAGKQFIAIGGAPISHALIDVADIYFPLWDASNESPKEAIDAAILALGGGRVLMSNLGNELIKRRFSVQDQGFSKLADLIYSLGGYIITEGESGPEKWIERA